MNFLELVAEQHKLFGSEGFKREDGNRFSELRESHQKLISVLPNKDIFDLNKLKQDGLYTKASGNGFSSIKENASEKVEKALLFYLVSLKGLIDLVMTAQSIASYIAMAESIREKMGLQAWTQLDEIVDYVWGLDASQGETPH